MSSYKRYLKFSKEFLQQISISKTDVDSLFNDEYPIVTSDNMYICVQNFFTSLVNPHFAIYNNSGKKEANNVLRLHIKDSGIITINHPLFKTKWDINNSIINDIKELLKLPNNMNPNYTNWNIICFSWNRYNHTLPIFSNMDEYMEGIFDHCLKLNSTINYVPSTQQIPETWDINFVDNSTLRIISVL